MGAAELFQVEHRSGEPLEWPGIPSLITLAHDLAVLGLMPSYGIGDHGNLSCRVPEGFVITARATRKIRLIPQEFVRIADCTRGPRGLTLVCDGTRLPSTDTLLHWRIYQARPDVGALIHVHDPNVLEAAPELGLPVTEVSARFNSHQLVEDVVRLASGSDFLVMRDHGCLALGRTLDQAAALALHWYHRVRGQS
jgi:ribulose-5-phosphate 4-epimerase/fuculose-1-phosphate aldolase